MSEKPPRKKSGKKTSKKKSSRSSSPKSRKSEDALPPAPPKAAPPAAPSCALHKKPFKFYAEASEQLVCEDCNVPSRLLALDEAFRYKLASLYNAVSSHLFSKREAIHASIKRFEWASGELQRAKELIEHDMKSEFSAMRERLQGAAGSKVAILENTLNGLRSDVERIDHVIGAVDSSNQDMVGFLRQSAKIKDLLEISMTKPFQSDIPVVADDLPAELVEIRNLVQQYSALEALIKFKDQLIWKVVNERGPPNTVKDSYKHEIAEWARLTDSMSQELNRFQMSCVHCGCELDQFSVNSNCEKHGQHYFSKGQPSAKPDKHTKKLLKKVKKAVDVKRIEAVLLQRDFNRIGLVSTTNFYSVLSQAGVQGKHIGKLLSVYQTGNDQVKYAQLVDELKKGKSISVDAVAQALREVDSNQEGKVSKTAFEHALNRAGANKKQVKKALKSAEVDGNGNVLYSTYLRSLQ